MFHTVSKSYKKKPPFKSEPNVLNGFSILLCNERGSRRSFLSFSVQTLMQDQKNGTKGTEMSPVHDSAV